jgi:two-component system, OmpR family, sensor histidine kinase QseC
MKMGQRSLLRRIVVTQVLVIVAFSLLALGNLLWQAKIPSKEENDKSMENSAQVFIQTVTADSEKVQYLNHDFAQIEELLRNFSQAEARNNNKNAQSLDFAMKVTSDAGQTIYRSTVTSDFQFEPQKTGFYDVWYANKKWRVLNYHAPEQKLRIEMAESSKSTDGELWQLIRKFIIGPLLVFLPFSVIAAWLSSRRGLMPLRELADMIARRSPSDMQPLTGVRLYAETQPVVQEINFLLQSLDTTLERERHFLADAAHELRTPLAVIQAQAHVLKHANTEAEKTAASDEVSLGIERAASLIQKLLITAKVSAPQFQPHWEEHDLSAFVQDRMATLSVLAARKNIEMGLQALPQCLVWIDRETFISAVDNVLDNAIRYTPVGGEIQVRISRSDADHVQLSVADNGPGIEPALHERVFERFFRVSGSEQLGSGLGLAIVKRVFDLHGGTVRLSAGLAHKGLTVLLTIPRNHIANAH